MINDLFHLGIPALEKVLRTVAVYLGIAMIIRVAGKRLMAQMNSLDLVVVLLLSNVVQNAIIGDDNSLTGGLLGAAVLVALNGGLERLARRSPAVAHVLEGRPTPVVRDGEVLPGSLARLGLSAVELDIALRHQGADEMGDVASAAMQPGGDLDVQIEREHRPLDQADLDVAMRELRAYLDQRLAGPDAADTAAR